MIYEYKCPQCETKFDVVKHHNDYNREEHCPNCDDEAARVFSTPYIPKAYHAEYNQGLGCVVKSKKHKEEICKRKGLIEVGSEKLDTIHKESEKTHKQKLSWEGV